MTPVAHKNYAMFLYKKKIFFFTLPLFSFKYFKYFCFDQLSVYKRSWKKEMMIVRFTAEKEIENIFRLFGKRKSKNQPCLTTETETVI